MGLGEIEAENAARDLVQGLADRLRGEEADILKSQAGIADTEEQRRLQARGLETQVEVAKAQALGSEFARSISILSAAEKRANPSLSPDEAENLAFQKLGAMSQRAGIDPNDRLWQESVNAAFEQVNSNPSMVVATLTERTNEAEKLARDMYRIKQGTPSTEFGGVSDEDLLNFGN
jgi:hypothetical protein